MSEDRTKHDRAGKGERAGLGHRVGKKQRDEGRTGMGQYVPDSVRDRIRGGDKPAKGGKGKAK